MMTCTERPVLQQADNFRRLVSCDSAGDAEGDLIGYWMLITDRRWIRGAANCAGESPASTHALRSVLTQRFVEDFACLLGGGTNVGNFPFHLTRANFVLGNAARLAGTGIDYRRCARLELPRAPRRYKNISVVAVKTLDQLHKGPSLEN